MKKKEEVKQMKPRVSLKEKLSKALGISEEFFILVDEPLSINFIDCTSNIPEIADKPEKYCVSCLTKYAIVDDNNNCANRFVEAPFLVLKDKVYSDDSEQYWIPGMMVEIYVYKKAPLKTLIDELKKSLEKEQYTWEGLSMIYNHYHANQKSIESIIADNLGVNQEFIEVVEGSINCPRKNLDKSINISDSKYFDAKKDMIKNSPLVIRANQPNKNGQLIEKVTVNRYSNAEDSKIIFNTISSRISINSKVAKEILNR